MQSTAQRSVHKYHHRAQLKLSSQLHRFTLKSHPVCHLSLVHFRNVCLSLKFTLKVFVFYCFSYCILSYSKKESELEKVLSTTVWSQSLTKEETTRLPDWRLSTELLCTWYRSIVLLKLKSIASLQLIATEDAF